MPKFEVFYPGEQVQKEPSKPSEPQKVQKKTVRVAVWQGGRLVECKKRERKSTM